jgi:hypothetical protein
VKSWRSQVLTAQTPKETLRLLAAAFEHFETLSERSSRSHGLRVAA